MTDNEKRELDYEVLCEDEGMRLDLFLNDRMVWRSRSSIQKLIDKKEVRRKLPAETGQPVLKAARRVKTGEVYGVTIPVPAREREALISEEQMVFPVLYEDPWLLVIDKPAGIPVHPGGRILERTVITRLNDGRTGAEPLKLCHRLDIETSGVLLVGKDPLVHPRFSALFEKREVVKEYLALVHGEMEKDLGEIDLPIGLDKSSRINMKRGIDHQEGQAARTGYRVERRFEGFTLVRLRLYTGRHHQLRVHLSAVGHPIVGDKAYGLDEELFILYHEGRLDDEARDKLILPRQALHAARLTLKHVVLEKEMTFEAPLPRDLEDFIKTLRPGREKN